MVNVRFALECRLGTAAAEWRAGVGGEQGKVMAQGELLGFYSTNPTVIAKLPK